ncbi:helix-turn-helix domain-containing protein [Saccharothrix obliqua]|uniref:helix-turn-helix domain-containing protein n=1 Tax=Saccharothrix obliqua TaxID=2861747 RepID=UPI001C5FFEFD|nr:helix-turn-helix domain-containing protein [Saccharothrix obliqua]MBW4717351.1 helix-turn-helix domain-containing protein [Saccharothrix obliqua]
MRTGGHTLRPGHDQHKPVALCEVVMSTTSTDPAKPRTEAEEKLWQALLDNAGGTAATLSATAGIGRSTASKILSRWAEEGIVMRTSGIADGGTYSADRWSVTTDGRHTNDGQPIDDQPVEAQPFPATENEVEPAGARLPPGALRGMVEDHLRENPGQEFSPNAIGTALGRSSGAVHNALEKLVTSGYAQRTNDKPKKYSLAPATGTKTGTGQ